MNNYIFLQHLFPSRFTKALANMHLTFLSALLIALATQTYVAQTPQSEHS
jgi:hypothetical protein